MNYYIIIHQCYRRIIEQIEIHLDAGNYIKEGTLSVVKTNKGESNS